MILKDINGNVVDGIIIGGDGVVYSVTNDIQGLTLGSDSCADINMNFTDGSCRWTQNSSDVADFDITPNQQEVINITQKEGCTYKVEFDYIFEFREPLDYNKLTNKLNLLDVKYYFQSVNNPTTIEGVSVIDSRTPKDRFTDTTKDSGFFSSLMDDSVLISNINQGYGININQSKVKSGWLKHSKKITEPNKLNNTIFGISVKNPIEGVIIKIDNITIVEDCHKQTTQTIYYNTNPSFEFERVSDNKKSWRVDDIIRDYNLLGRDTKYNVKDDRLIINSKELDLKLSFNNSLETEYYDLSMNNPDIINSSMHGNLDIFREFDVTSDELDTLGEFIGYVVEQFNNPRSYRTLKYNYIIQYMLLEFEQYDIVSFTKLQPIIKKLDKYWLDIIAQFVPSTAIWESNIQYGNLELLQDKYEYKKYRLSEDTNKIGTTDINVNTDWGTANLNIINYSLAGDFYSELETATPIPVIMIEYDVTSGVNNADNLCGGVMNNTTQIFTHSFDVGQTVYSESELINEAIQPPNWYLSRYNGERWAIYLNNGVIEDIRNLNTCILREFILKDKPYDRYVLACDDIFDKNDSPKYTLYVSNFNIGEQVFSDINYTPYDNGSIGMYYPVMIDGAQYSIQLDHGEITDIRECSGVIPPPKAITNYNVVDHNVGFRVTPADDPNGVVEFIKMEIVNPTNGNPVGGAMVTPQLPTTDQIVSSIIVGTVNIRACSVGFNGAQSTWIYKNGVSVGGNTGIIIPDNLVTNPCKYQVIDPSNPDFELIKYAKYKDFDEMLSYVSATPNAKVQLYNDPQLIDKFVPANAEPIGFYDGNKSKFVMANINNNGELATIKPCEPLQSVIKLEVSEPVADCVIFDPSIAQVLYNDGGLRKFTKFYRDVELTKPFTEITAYNGKKMVAKVEGNAEHKILSISNGMISTLPEPCNPAPEPVDNCVYFNTISPIKPSEVIGDNIGKYELHIIHGLSSEPIANRTVSRFVFDDEIPLELPRINADEEIIMYPAVNFKESFGRPYTMDGREGVRITYDSAQSSTMEDNSFSVLPRQNTSGISINLKFNGQVVKEVKECEEYLPCKFVIKEVSLSGINSQEFRYQHNGMTHSVDVNFTTPVIVSIDTKESPLIIFDTDGMYGGAGNDGAIGGNDKYTTTIYSSDLILSDKINLGTSIFTKDGSKFTLKTGC